MYKIVVLVSRKVIKIANIDLSYLPKNSTENSSYFLLAEPPAKPKASVKSKEIEKLVQNNDKITKIIDEVVQVNTSETKVTNIESSEVKTKVTEIFSNKPEKTPLLKFEPSKTDEALKTEITNNIVSDNSIPAKPNKELPVKIELAIKLAVEALKTEGKNTEASDNIILSKTDEILTFKPQDTLKNAVDALKTEVTKTETSDNIILSKPYEVSQLKSDDAKKFVAVASEAEEASKTDLNESSSKALLNSEGSTTFSESEKVEVCKESPVSARDLFSKEPKGLTFFCSDSSCTTSGCESEKTEECGKSLGRKM